MTTAIKCIRCPMCDELPTMAVSPAQVFCGNDDCPVFCWNTLLTKEENRRDIKVIDLDE